MTHIDKRIEKVLIKNKGYGFITKEDIPINEILIKDIPTKYIQESKIYSEVFQLLHKIVTDTLEFKKFNNLYPKSLNEYCINKNIITNELEKLKKYDKELYNFFIENYTFDDLLLFCSKYSCNAFEMDSKPVMLYTGAMLNHSCLPNVIFGKKNNMMCYSACREIKKGDEICDNYIDITLPTNKRKDELLERYGFICSCIRCCEKNKNKIKEYDNQVLEIEKLRKKEYGYTKSKFV